MNIYNKVTLSVILVITILISFIFYFFNKEDKLDKDDLYENKIANRKSATSDEQKTYGVASNNACLLYTSPSPRDATLSRMPSSA